RIGELRGAGPDLIPFFAGELLIVYGLFAVNLGQGERRWKGPFQGGYGHYLIHIIVQLLLGLLAIAPAFLIFKVLAYARPMAAVWGGAYLFGYGSVLALFGLLLGTLASEVAQFQLKYLGLGGYLAGSLFWPPGSPFFNLMLLLKGEGYPLISAPGPLLLALMGGLLLFLTRRRIERWSSPSSS
ncbi:MAG: hypothetical protein ACE5KR_03785, partial [Candidatus Bipolaricaulia bacterium]